MGQFPAHKLPVHKLTSCPQLLPVHKLPSCSQTYFLSASALARKGGEKDKGPVAVGTHSGHQIKEPLWQRGHMKTGVCTEKAAAGGRVYRGGEKQAGPWRICGNQMLTGSSEAPRSRGDSLVIQCPMTIIGEVVVTGENDFGKGEGEM